MSTDSYRIVGTAGHIDHGKSALVRALTGIDPDRLREEKERGITIDLGFADTSFGDLQVGFIDVPGHERFVKNMLAGIGGIDAVLLVIAADESIMPQTREHLAICRLLGIGSGVVALTKRDLVDEEIAEIAEIEVHELLAGTFLEAAPVVCTSATTGEGIEELGSALAACLRSTPPRAAGGVLRLPIDRVFTVRGFGTVVTGTLLSGDVAVGQRLEILPTGKEVTVRGVQVHGRDTGVARGGQRTALNLQGVALEELERGMVLAGPGTLRAGHLIDARVEVLREFEQIDHLQRVRFHHGSAEVLGRVAILEGDRIAGGSGGYVQLRLETPYPAVPGDRFILRRYSPVITIGGGVVIDTPAVKARRRAAAGRRSRRLHEADAARRVAILVQEAGIAGLSCAELAVRIARPTARAAALVREAQERGDVVLLEGAATRAVPAAAFTALLREIPQRIAAYHECFPLRPAMPKQELRTGLTEPAPDAVLDEAIGRLVADDVVRPDADGFALTRHLARLPPGLRALSEDLIRHYRESGLAPPATEAAFAAVDGDRDEVREVFHYLLRSGELLRVRDDLVLYAEALERLVHSLAEDFPRGSQFSVGDFKNWAGVSRKHAIPLLEYLDSKRITRRVGDLRERI